MVKEPEVPTRYCKSISSINPPAVCPCVATVYINCTFPVATLVVFNARHNAFTLLPESMPILPTISPMNGVVDALFCPEYNAWFALGAAVKTVVAKVPGTFHP